MLNPVVETNIPESAYLWLQVRNENAAIMACFAALRLASGTSQTCKPLGFHMRREPYERENSSYAMS